MGLAISFFIIQLIKPRKAPFRSIVVISDSDFDFSQLNSRIHSIRVGKNSQGVMLPNTLNFLRYMIAPAGQQKLIESTQTDASGQPYVKQLL